MILWRDGPHGPAENMRRDLALLEAAESGAEPVLRLFRFAPAGITLGRTQDAATELDLARCQADQVPWATRPTGGRAIFHADEWTYSLAASRRHPDWGGSLADAYARASSLIMRSLIRLGVPAEFARGRGAGPSPGRRMGPAAPCFASAARHELALDGRKLVGSAQRRTALALLQQGSVLLGPGHLRLVDYLAVSPDRREGLRATLEAATACAGAWLGNHPSLESWAAALRTEIGTGCSLVVGEEGTHLLTARASHSYTACAT